jgi:hypothetical protein|tara:strand:- start:444 stop:713 length:270 start_codon:yes stop_codon:yes gene_type:complete
MSNSVIDRIIKLNPEALTADGYDRAIIGITKRNDNHVVLYSSEKCIRQLMEDNNWTEEESLEWFSYNTESAYMGENTPVFQWNDYDCDE